jgi:hypothetical protein
VTDLLRDALHTVDDVAHDPKEFLREVHLRARPCRTSRTVPLAVVAVLLALAGGLLVGPGGWLGTSRPADANHHDPGKLYGSWNVRDDRGQASGAIILGSAARLFTGRDRNEPDRTFSLLLPCGVLTGKWAAQPDGAFQIDGFGGPGCSGTDVPRWLRTAAGFRDHGDQELLLDRDGHVVATLVNADPPGEPAPDPTGGRVSG